MKGVFVIYNGSKVSRHIVAALIMVITVICAVALSGQTASAVSKVYYQLEAWGGTYYVNSYGGTLRAYKNFHSEKDYYEAPRVFVVNGTEKEYLSLNEDYTFEYYKDGQQVTSVKEIGKYTLTIIGKGKYAEEGILRTFELEIIKPVPKDLSKLGVWYE